MKGEPTGRRLVWAAMIAWIRTGLLIVSGFVVTVIVSAMLIVVAAIRPNSPLLDRILRKWSQAWFTLGGVTFSAGGATIDESRSYVIVSNHQSNFDIMADLLAVPVPGRFMAKKELYRIPVVGAAMKATGMVKVDRTQHGSSVHAQLTADARANTDAARSVIVYPEGTRSRTGELMAFKRGAFAIAIAGQLPILPVTIAGSHRAWPPKGAVRGGPIVARVHDPIETVGMTKDDIASLSEQVRAAIAADLADLNDQLLTDPHHQSRK